MKYGLLIVFVSIYIFQLLVKFKIIDIDNSFVINYLADILCLPILLIFSEIFIQKIQNNPFYKISKLQVFVVFVYISVIFEWILPSFSSKFTADSNDILAYAIGGIFFVIYQKYYINH